VWQYVLQPAKLGPVATFAALMGPGGLMIFGAAYGFYRAFEEPFVRQGKEKTASQTEAAPARVVT